MKDFENGKRTEKQKEKKQKKMTQILSIDNQSKEIIIYKDGEIFDIEKGKEDV